MLKRSLLLLALAGMVIFATSAFTVSANGDCTFTLFGSAQPDTDPENPSNEVVSIDGSAGFGGVNKVLPAGTQADEIDNQVNVKYFFVTPKTCTLGSPRISLRIDSDGDGDLDFNAHGNLGPLAFGGGCVTGTWTFADLTDAAPRWDLSQGGGGMTLNWDAMEIFLATTYPSYQILRGTLVEDGYPGIGYYDLLTIGDCTLDGNEDIAPPDADNDGVPDPNDNCPNTANPGQQDSDNDGIGDACDAQTGPPVNKDQCKNGGWANFNFPRTFNNQGDCIQFVNTGK